MNVLQKKNIGTRPSLQCRSKDANVPSQSYSLFAVLLTRTWSPMPRPRTYFKNTRPRPQFQNENSLSTMLCKCNWTESFFQITLRTKH